MRYSSPGLSALLCLATFLTLPCRAQIQAPKDLPELAQGWMIVESAPGRATPEHFAQNLGVNYQLVKKGTTLGAFVTRAPRSGTPASTIGIEAGDIIFALDGLPIRKPDDLLEPVDRTTISLIDVRDGVTRDLIAHLPAGERKTPLPGGISLGITAHVRTIYPPPSPRQLEPASAAGQSGEPPIFGLEITAVTAGSPAELAGLRVGDVIAYFRTTAGNWVPTSKPTILRRAMEDSGRRMNLLVCRNYTYRNLVPIAVMLY